MRPLLFSLRHLFSCPLCLRPVCILWPLVSCVAFITVANAQSISDRFTGDPKVPWRISADTIGYDSVLEVYTAEGNVVIEKQEVRLVADKIRFDNKAMTASADGNILMTAGDDVLTGNRIELDLEKEIGILHDGSVFMKENHFIIRGDRIEKTGKETYRAENATVTTCDGERPDWQLHGRTVNVTIEGYGTAKHATFNVRNVPVLYSPYLFFPVKTKRQTGFLLPEGGLSDRQGFNWDQPFFWAIDDNTDATVIARYMEKRGTKIGLEYRYALSENSLGTLMADGMEDRKIDDGTADNTAKWGYDDDDYTRPNTDRYWLRAKADQQLPWRSTAKLDLDLVSDKDYLTEFRDGNSGYYATRNAFRKTFGRDLDTYDENIRTNRLNVNRIWPRFSFNGDLLWYDDVTKRRWEEIDDTLQQLPVLKFDAAKQQALDTLFFWDLDSEYSYFYREDGDRGHRLDILPRAYLPYRWKNFLSVEPSVGWRQTAWQLDEWEDETIDRSSYREIFDAQVDLSTEVEKVMSSPVDAADRIRHTLKPRVIYNYVPGRNQSDLPSFTDTDRIEATNTLTYSLTNIFTAKRSARVKAAVPPNHENRFFEQQGFTGEINDGAALSTPYRYDRFCRFYLVQSYHISTPEGDEQNAFSDIIGELDFNFGRTLFLDSDANFDPYEGRFSSHTIAAAMSDTRGDRLWIEHQYRRSISESIRGSLSLKLTDRLTARGKYERNLAQDRDITKGIGFLFTAQCWSLDFFYSVEETDNKFSFFINLMGIGGFGQ